MIWVVLKKSGEPARAVETVGDLVGLRSLLGGPDVYLDWFHWSKDVHGYCDDDGHRKMLPLNFTLIRPPLVWEGKTTKLAPDPVVGPVVFSQIDGKGDEKGFADQASAERFAADFNAQIVRAMGPGPGRD